MNKRRRDAKQIKLRRKNIKCATISIQKNIVKNQKDIETKNYNDGEGGPKNENTNILCEVFVNYPLNGARDAKYSTAGFMDW